MDLQQTIRSFHRMNSNNERRNIMCPEEAQSPVLSVRHQKVKSLSLRTSKNSDSVTRILRSKRKEIKLKDSFVRPVKLKRIIQDSSKSISTADTFADSIGSPTKVQRSKSIQKKTLLNRRNLQHMMSTRQKVTYSANNSSMHKFTNLNEVSLENSNRPNYKISDMKLKNYGYMSVAKDRRRQHCRPFNLVPIDSPQKRLGDGTRNGHYQEDFSLPNIFKDTLIPSDNESEPSIFDMECDESTNASPTQKRDSSDSD